MHLESLIISIEQIDKVDAMGLDRITGHIVLTIADSWDWCDENQHLLALQEKLNAYLNFVDSGQVWESFDSRQAEKLRINVVFRHHPPASALEFLGKVSSVAAEIQVLLSYEVFKDQNKNYESI